MITISLIANLRSRWSWIDNTLIQSIINEDFDIHSFPKLHMNDFLRKRFIISVIEEFFILMNNPKIPKFQYNILKLYTSFNDIDIFLFVWYIYIMIHEIYHIEYFSYLIHWIEQINQFHHTDFAWNNILTYIIQYFQCHQNASFEIWYLINQELMSS